MAPPSRTPASGIPDTIPASAKVVILAIALGIALILLPLSKLVQQLRGKDRDSSLFLLARPSPEPPTAKEEIDPGLAGDLVQENWTLRLSQMWQRDAALVFATFVRAVPPQIRLDRLTLEEHRKIAVEGRAAHLGAIADFLENLERSPGFSEPDLLDLYQSGDGAYFFSLRCEAWGWRAERGTRPPPKPTLRREVSALQGKVCHLLAHSDLPLEMCAAGTLDRGQGAKPLPALRIRLEPASQDDLIRLLDRLGELSHLVVAEELELALRSPVRQAFAVEVTLTTPISRSRRSLPAGSSGGRR